MAVPKSLRPKTEAGLVPREQGSSPGDAALRTRAWRPAARPPRGLRLGELPAASRTCPFRDCSSSRKSLERVSVLGSRMGEEGGGSPRDAAWKLVADRPLLYHCHDFLTPEECEARK